MGSPPKLPIMIVPAGDLRPKAFGRIGLPCPSTTRRGGTQAPRDKNLSEPLEARTTASPSWLPWAVKAAEVTPCCPPPGDQWGSIPQGSSPLPQIQIHAISINTGMQHGRKFDQPPLQHVGVASELVSEEEDLRLRLRTSRPPRTLSLAPGGGRAPQQDNGHMGTRADSDGSGVRQWQAAGTSSDLDSLGKSNHSTKETLSLPTCKDAGPYWARTRD